MNAIQRSTKRSSTHTTTTKNQQQQQYETSSNNNNNNNHSNKQSKPTLIDLNGVPVAFPFEPYPVQQDYMTKVIEALQRGENALLESPTGTGKTLCLLCSVLAWQKYYKVSEDITQNQQQDQKDEEPCISSYNNFMMTQEDHSATKKKLKPTIIYASRTHSQLAQVVKELKATRYRPRHALLSSREHTCVNEKVLKKAGDVLGNINHECAKLGKERRCMYRNNLEHFSGPREAVANGEMDSSQTIMDIEELVTMGKKSKVCPFYYSRNAVENADLVLLPYNYLFDEEARKTMDIRWKGAVVIFDEAHNLESFASDSASFDLKSVDIAGCINEVQKAIGIKTQPGSEDDGRSSVNNWVKLKSIFLQIEEMLQNSSPQGGSYEGKFIFDFFGRLNITFSTFKIFIDCARDISDTIMEARGGMSSATPKLDHFSSCLRKIFGNKTEAQCLAKSVSYRVHISAVDNRNITGGTSNKKERALSYWCFAPAVAMRDLHNLGLRSIIVTSGTLSPLQSYALELGIPFKVQLENPHIVKSNQIHVRVIGSGVSAKELESSYNRRNTPEYINELGHSLAALAKVVPGGMLVFFPSYGVMEKCVTEWGGPTRNRSNWSDEQKKQNFFRKKTPSNSKQRYSFSRESAVFQAGTSSPWKRMLSNKAIVLEPQVSSLLQDAIDDFDRFISDKSSNGCILMGVCRGKVSEGIDFSDEKCRAVIITGLPFAPVFDPRVKLKKEYLDANKANASIRASNNAGFGPPSIQSTDFISGSDWYLQQAHRAINQAVGRVIRHRFDYGSVILMDSRFSDPRNQNGLSKWLRPAILPDETYGKAISGLVKFFKQAAADQSLKRLEEESRKRRERMNLEYEKEVKLKAALAKEAQTEKGGVTRIAVIKSVDGTEDNEDSTYVKPEQVVKRFEINSGVIDTHEPVSESNNKANLNKNHTRKPIVVKKTPLLMPTEISSKTSEPVPLSDKIKSAWSGSQAAFKSKSTVKANIAKKMEERQLRREGLLGDTRPKKSNNNNLSSQAQMRMKNVATNREIDNDIAVKLFTTMKEKLTTLHVQKIQKYISYCKKLDEGDEKYAKVAIKVVTILKQYDPSDLVPLFLTLLPKPVRPKVTYLMINTSQNCMSSSSDQTTNEVGGLNKKGTLPRLSEPASKSLHLGCSLSSTSMIEKEKLKNRVKQKWKEVENGQNGNQKITTNLRKLSTSKASSLKRPYNMMAQKETQLTQRSATIDKVLKAATKDVFVKKKYLAPKIKSNVPEGVHCSICDLKPKKPLLAPCGHSACEGCWGQWLERSKTCPVCRKPTTQEKLDQLVYQKKKNEQNSNPTISQIIVETDDEEELELV